MIFLSQILVFQFRPLFTKLRLLFIIITVTLVYLSSSQNTVYPLGSRDCVICKCALLGWGFCFLQVSSSSPQSKPHWSSKPGYFEGPSSWFRTLGCRAWSGAQIPDFLRRISATVITTLCGSPLRDMVLTILCLHSCYLFAVVPSLYHIFCCRGLSC